MSDPNTVANDQIVSIGYVLTDEGGNLLDRSQKDKPLSYLHGHGNIIPGLEKALEGKKVGDQVSLTATPEEGYGAHDPEQVFEVPREKFDFEVKPGQVVRVQTPSGASPPIQVTAVSDTVVTLDGNHPLAGKTLHFEVTVEAVRPATEAEIAHGHSHADHE